jgi:predicted dehydrogenase
MSVLGVLGYGLVGKQRVEDALAFGILPQDIYVMDPLKQMSGFNTGINSLSTSKFSAMNFENVIVATPHDVATDWALHFLSSGARVLLEKPMGRNLFEAQKLAEHKLTKNLSLGFNYRHMEGIKKLRALIRDGSLGELSRIRIELGHGGSPQDINSWKLDPIKCGGGALLDPGIHIIDLLLHLNSALAGDISIGGGVSWKGFWKTGIEETVSINGKLRGIPFVLDVSVVAWRTRFNVEILGTEGYAELSGRGRSDGPQKLISGKRWGWLEGKSQKDSEVLLFSNPIDNSFRIETSAWLNGQSDVCDSKSGFETMRAYSSMVKQIEKEIK